MNANFLSRLLGGIDSAFANLRRYRGIELLAECHASPDLLRRRLGLDA